MILFIHGFSSCGLGTKSEILIRHFGEAQVLTPNLPFEPLLAIEALEKMIADQPIDLLVGSSLGGYYATWLNRKDPLPTILINPAVRPYELLDQYRGEHERWCDGEKFSVTDSYLQQLLGLYRKELAENERYLVLLQKGDETLDYRDAADYYKNHELMIEPGGCHRFVNFEQYMVKISSFAKGHLENRNTK